MNKYRRMGFAALLIAYREKIKATYAYGGSRGYCWDYQVHLIQKMEEELLRRPVYTRTAERHDAHCAELARAAANERDRQREEEGFSEDHDRQHTLGELVHASACYLRASLYPYGAQEMPVPPSWPFEPEAWKPTSAQRNLEKALALILAEETRINQCETRKVSIEKIRELSRDQFNTEHIYDEEQAESEILDEDAAAEIIRACGCEPEE